MVWPIMQSRRVEISARGPDERVNFSVELYLSELCGISQRTKELALEHRLKVDGPSQAIMIRIRWSAASDL